MPKYKESQFYSGKEIIPIFFFRITSDFNEIKTAIEKYMTMHGLNKYFLYEEIRNEEYKWTNS